MMSASLITLKYKAITFLGLLNFGSIPRQNSFHERSRAFSKCINKRSFSGDWYHTESDRIQKETNAGNYITNQRIRFYQNIRSSEKKQTLAITSSNPHAEK